MNKPKIKNELKNIEIVIKDPKRLEQLNKRTERRQIKNPNYINKAQKSIHKYIKYKFTCYKNIANEIDCEKSKSEEIMFETSYEHLDKLNNYLSRLTKTMNTIKVLSTVLNPQLATIYISEYNNSCHKLIKRILNSNINSSQLLALITWIATMYEKFLKSYDLQNKYHKQIKHLTRRTCKLYVDSIKQKNHNFIANMVINDHNSSLLKNKKMVRYN